MSTSFPPPKKLSGAQNLKRKKEREEEKEKQTKKNAISKYFIREVSETSPSKLNINAATCFIIAEPVVEENDNNQMIEDTDTTKPSTDFIDEKDNQPCTIFKSILKADMLDIAKWPQIIPSNVREEIVTRGPQKPKMSDSEYPQNHEGRHFSNNFYQKIMPNEEIYKRQWLIYSKSVDKVFCFCCKLFCSLSSKKSNLGKSGIDDWKHLSERLKLHETAAEHSQALSNWMEVRKRLTYCSGIDKELQKQIDAESNRWRNVLKRLFAIVLFLAENNLSFRGKTNKFNTPNNGNFMGLAQLLGNFDVIMMDHIRRVISKEINVHYCGNIIQNELISVMAEEVRQGIINKVKSAKYFSIILDCTPDISHEDQMSFITRIVDTNDEDEDISIKEFFITYAPVSDSSGAGITGLFLDNVISKYDLDMNNCRGQGFDNGANMVGINKGVQARILQQYPRAVFNPCGCHSLNLVVADGVKATVKSVSLFGILQRVYVLFVGSTKRWAVISSHVNNMTLKKVCDTRWESRISSLAAIRYQYAEVYNALWELHEETSDSVVASEAKSLAENMEKSDFILTLVAWYDILFQVNIVSKTLQSESTDLPTAISLLEKCMKFISEFRKSGYISCLITSKEIISEIDVELKFEEKRVRRKKRNFDYEGMDEVPTNAEQLYITTVFNPMVDTVAESLRTRFELLRQHNGVWSFLYDLNKFKTPQMQIDLQKSCNDLHLALKDGKRSDVNGNELYEEILRIQTLLDPSAKPREVLKLLKRNCLQDIFPNIWIALRILLTLPVTVASAERSFSKLKLIKTYLRSTMGDERLSDLALLSIENEMAHKLDFSALISKFASAKARKVNFK